MKKHNKGYRPKWNNISLFFPTLSNHVESQIFFDSKDSTVSGKYRFE